MERDIHVALVLEVEKHECLYNSSLPDYCRKDVTEEAWRDISNNLHLPVFECKDKWRNIRSTFRRSFKPSKYAKPKRTYYLSRYLNFILPYSKPMDDSIFREDYSSADDNYLSMMIKNEDCDNSVNEDDEGTSAHNLSSWDDAQSDQEVQAAADRTSQETSSNHCRTMSTEEEFSIPEHLRTNSENKDCLLDQSEKDHMKYFFLSLLPEFKNMSEKQMRTFKIRVLQLIDHIKTERQPK